MNILALKNVLMEMKQALEVYWFYVFQSLNIEKLILGVSFDPPGKYSEYNVFKGDKVSVEVASSYQISIRLICNINFAKCKRT